MSRIPMPNDRESAESVLGRFMDNAFNFQFENNFKTAIDIIHGPYFVIQRDSSLRMYFHCTVLPPRESWTDAIQSPHSMQWELTLLGSPVTIPTYKELCNKDMNSVRAVNEHALSGTHNKNKDLESDKNFLPKSNQNYHHSTLHYKVVKTDPSIAIIGLQMIETYDQGWGYLYYKCILCGAHGKVDPMYKHIIGNKHTDRYIKSRIILKTATISGEERDALRKRIFAKENYTESDIKTIKGREYFPYKWEEEGRKAKFKWPREMTDSPPPPKCTLSDESAISTKKSIKREKKDSSSESEEEQTRFRNPSPESFLMTKTTMWNIKEKGQSWNGEYFRDTMLTGEVFPSLEIQKMCYLLMKPHFYIIRHPCFKALQIQELLRNIAPVIKLDKGIQAYSIGFMENILLKLNLIVQAHLIKETDLRSPDDLRVALKIMRYALHLFYFVFGEGDSQRQVVKTCLGFLMVKLIPLFEKNFGKVSL